MAAMWRFGVVCVWLAGCGAPSAPDGGGIDAGARDVPPDDVRPIDATDAGLADGPDAGPPRSAVDAARDRLLASYLAYLRAHAAAPQTNGLGASLVDVCELWSRATPATRATFLGLTDRLDGARLADGSSALAHVTALYRVVGGEGETASDPGSCGGGEFNRMIVSIDPALHAAFVAAHRSGGDEVGGVRDLDDLGASYWRDARDLAGPHAPFTLSDETEGGAPRGQAHLFEDPTSAAALSPLGRTDLETLVDPYALEIDHDYDCVHASNPLCDYTFYGPACLPRTGVSGVEMYGASYRAIDLAWSPLGC